MSQSSEMIVVAGAGLMGTGIAHAFASSGFATVLVDTNSAALTRARNEIAEILASGVKLGKRESQGMPLASFVLNYEMSV